MVKMRMISKRQNSFHIWLCLSHLCIDPSMFIINVRVFPNMDNDAANNINFCLSIFASRLHCWRSKPVSKPGIYPRVICGWHYLLTTLGFNCSIPRWMNMLISMYYYQDYDHNVKQTPPLPPKKERVSELMHDHS